MVYLTSIKVTPDIIRMEKDNYPRFTYIFGLPRQNTKDVIRTEVSVFGIEVNISFLITLNQRNKLQKLSKMAIAKLDLWSMTFLNAQILIGILLFLPRWYS